MHTDCGVLYIKNTPVHVSERTCGGLNLGYEAEVEINGEKLFFDGSYVEVQLKVGEALAESGTKHGA